MTELSGQFASVFPIPSSNLYAKSQPLAPSLMSYSRPSPFTRPSPLTTSTTSSSVPIPSSFSTYSPYSYSYTKPSAPSNSYLYSTPAFSTTLLSGPTSSSSLPSTSSFLTGTSSYLCASKPSAAYSTTNTSYLSSSSSSYLYSVPSTPLTSTTSQYVFTPSPTFSYTNPTTYYTGNSSSTAKSTFASDQLGSISAKSQLPTSLTDSGLRLLDTTGKISGPKADRFELSPFSLNDPLKALTPEQPREPQTQSVGLSISNLSITPSLSRPLPVPSASTSLLKSTQTSQLPYTSFIPVATDWRVTPVATFAPPFGPSFTAVSSASGVTALDSKKSSGLEDRPIVQIQTTTLATAASPFEPITEPISLSVPRSSTLLEHTADFEKTSFSPDAEKIATGIAAPVSRESVHQSPSPQQHTVVHWPTNVQVSALLDEWPLHAAALSQDTSEVDFYSSESLPLTSPTARLALGFECGLQSPSTGIGTATHSATSSALHTPGPSMSHTFEVECGLVSPEEVDWGSPKDFQAATAVIRTTRSATASRPNSVFEPATCADEELSHERRARHKYSSQFEPVTLDVDKPTWATAAHNGHGTGNKFEFPSVTPDDQQQQQLEAPGESSSGVKLQSRSRSHKSSRSSRGSRSSSTSGPVDSARTKLDLLVDFLHRNSNDFLDCRGYLHTFLATSPELNFVAFQQKEILGLMGGVFVDDERTTAWIGTWHELGPEGTADAAGRALLEKCTAAIKLYSNAHVLLGTLFVGMGLPAGSASEELLAHLGYELIEDEVGLGRSAWDGLTWQGHVEPAALERARKELQTCSSGMVASLQVVRVNALTSAIIELDARLTGLRRSHYLRAIAASACETLECWFGVALVGYAFMLELRRAYWIVQVMCAHEGGGVDGDDVLSRAIGLRLMFEHFGTVIQRERSASKSHRKRVMFVSLRGALDLPHGPVEQILEHLDKQVGCAATTSTAAATSDSSAEATASEKLAEMYDASDLFTNPFQVKLSSSISLVRIFRRLGLTLSAEELEHPTRRWVRREGKEVGELERVPNLWNRCAPPPGLLVVPDSHLPPF